MKKKYVIKKNIFKNYILFLYFLIVFFFFLAFSLNIEITKKIESYGVVSNYVKDKKYYSHYKGRVINLYINEGDKIVSGQIIADFYVENVENVHIENKISYNQSLLKSEKNNSNNPLLIKEYEKEILALNKIKNYETIYFNYDNDYYYYVDNIFVEKNDKITYQDQLFSYKNDLKNDLFYIKSYITPEFFNSIHENDKVIIDFYQMPDKSLKYEGVIDKKHSQIFKNDIVFNETNGKINELAYKINIRILNDPKNIKEGLGVHISIIKGKISLFDYFINHFKEFYAI
jgi:hypothetical protein